MRKITLIVCFSFLFFGSLTAQLTLVIDSLPDYTPPGDIIYVAGDFQGWNPGDPNFALQKNNEDKWMIVLDAMTQGTTIQFKFTRGDWGTVEKGIFGEEIPNRTYTFGNGDIVGINIYNWADNGGGGNSTAAENVFIMDDAFYMPQLDRDRRIWIYLPPDYETSGSYYPVIYMHDGQNLFDTYTSFAGEWEVDETLNNLYDDGFSVPIVIGIDNGGAERINELTPWQNPNYGGGDGALYMDFIIETLKPYVDENYRTLPERESTAIWGSSLGGLISFYGSVKYQDIFSKAGIFSPSYWFSDSVWTFCQEMGHQQDMKLYQMAGSLEGGSMVSDTWAMHDSLSDIGFTEDELSTKIVVGGQHNEQLWREDFEAAYLWLFHAFANGVNTHRINQSITISPNPLWDSLILPNEINSNSAWVKIYNVQGCIEISTLAEKGETINVSELKTGTYLLEILTDETLYRSKFLKR